MNQDSESTDPLEPEGPLKYWAFISYSHRDIPWGEWLHRALETYRVPRRLTGRPSRDGRVPARLYPIFRDRDELPTAASLSDNIEHSLRQSRYLIVICSPHAAASRWVDQEVLFFKTLGRDDRILALIVDGKPHAAESPSAGLPECFPPALRHRRAPHGELTEEPTEPIAADVRPGRDSRQIARLRLLAGLLGVSFDELRQRERQRVIRNRVRWACLALAVVALLAGVWQWQEQRRREVARQAKIEQLSEAGRQELVAGQTLRAAVYLSEAFRLGGDQTSLRVMLALALRPLDAQIGTLQGHAQSVNRAAFSPDGRRLLTVSDDGLAILWDAETQQSVGRLAGHKWFVRIGGFLTNDRVFTVGSEDAVKLWNAASGELLATLDGERAAASHDGRRLVTALKGQAVVWETETAKRVATLQAPTLHLSDVAFGPDGSRVAGGGGLDVDPPPNARPRGRIWNAGTGEVLAWLEGHTGTINALAFAPDGARVATASADRSAKVWDVETGRLLASFGEHPGAVSAATFSPDGARLLTFSENVAVLWNLSQPEQPVVMLHKEWISDARLSPDGTRVGTAATDNLAYLWDAASGQLLLSLDGHTGPVQTVEFRRDGRRIVTASADGSAKVWNAGGSAVTVLNATRRISSVAFSPDGGRLTVAGAQAEVWDAPSGNVIQSIDAHPQWGVRTVAFSPDGGRLVTASEDRTCKVLDLATAQEVVHFRGHDARALSASFNSDGRRVVSAALDHTVQVWDAATGAVIVRIRVPAGQISWAAFSPDDKQLAVAAGLSIGLWDAETGRLQTQLPDQATAPGHVAFHPRGRQVASTDGKQVNLWDVSSRTQVTSYVGHTAQVNHIAFNSDGTLLVSASHDGTLRLWDVQSGKVLSVLAGHHSAVDRAEFRSDGRHIASSSDDQAVRLWDVSPESRSPQGVADLVRNRVPARIVQGVLAPE